MIDALAQIRSVWGSRLLSVCGAKPVPGSLGAHVCALPAPLAAATGVSSLGCSGGVFVILSDIVKRWVRVTKDAGRVGSTCCKKCDWPVAGVVQFSKDPELGALPISPLAHASDARGFRRIRLKLNESAGRAALVNVGQGRQAASRTDARGAVPAVIRDRRRRAACVKHQTEGLPGARRPIADRAGPAPEGVDRPLLAKRPGDGSFGTREDSDVEKTVFRQQGRACDGPRFGTPGRVRQGSAI